MRDPIFGRGIVDPFDEQYEIDPGGELWRVKSQPFDWGAAPDDLGFYPPSESRWFWPRWRAQ